MKLKEIEKLRCGAYVKYHIRDYVIVGQQETYFYALDVKDYTTRIKIPFEALDMVELTGYEPLDKVDLMLIKLRMTFKDAEIGEFQDFEPIMPVNVMQGDYINVTHMPSLLVPFYSTLMTELQWRNPYMSINPDIVIRAIDMKKDSYRANDDFVKGKIEVLLAKDGYILKKLDSEIAGLYLYLPAPKYEVKGEMTITKKRNIEKILCIIQRRYDEDVELSYTRLTAKYSKNIADSFATFASLNNGKKIKTLCDFIQNYIRGKLILNEINTEIEQPVPITSELRYELRRLTDDMKPRQYLSVDAVQSCFLWLEEIICL